MKSPYTGFVFEFSRLLREGRNLPLGGFAPRPTPAPAPDAPKVLLFSPHPDDEVIIGGLALRFLREAGMNVINVAVTQGSKKERQAGRLAELEKCCGCIGFGLMTTVPGGLEKVNPKTRGADPAHWAASVEVIRAILEREKPAAIFFPHDADWNSSHLGTHWLVMDALRKLGPAFRCLLVETEFWGQMDDPNLMVESTVEEVADLITALTDHVEEVRRNPYHLMLPAWMIDNVRRGCELVGGQGGAAPDFTFATLYKVRQWTGTEAQRFYEGGRYLPKGADPRGVFPPA